MKAIGALLVPFILGTARHSLDVKRCTYIRMNSAALVPQIASLREYVVEHVLEEIQETN